MAKLRALVVVAVAGLLSGCGSGEQARHELAIPWSLGGRWLIADLHMHTRFSDGRLSVEELVSRATVNGCDAIAITDHGDPALSVSPEFFQQVEAQRRKLPDLVLLAGLEWNVPPYGGREHMSLIVDPALEQTLLPQFKTLFDLGSKATSAAPAFAWLATMVKEPAQHVLIYNHPLRHAKSSPAQVEQDLDRWKASGSSLVGFEGGPGHQKMPKLGSYSASNPLQDRWDPAAAQVGGPWDRLLARGVNLWGALADSDYHNDQWDEEPCRFSQTFLQVPERSTTGVLQAIRAGTFWAAQGKFLRHLSLTVHAPGLTVPASPGEIIRYRTGGEVSVRVAAERSVAAADRSLSAEVISNCRGGKTETVATVSLEPGKSEAEVPIRNLTPGDDGASCYVRARVRNARGTDGDLLAYTNPVRIRLND